MCKQTEETFTPSRRTNRKKLIPAVFGVLTLTLAFAPQYCGAILAIELLDTRYTTFVSTTCHQDLEIITNSRTLVSLSPINDSLFHPVTGKQEARSEAPLFGISAFTGVERRDFNRIASFASAKTEIRFSPTTTENALVGFNFFGAYEFYYSEGFVSLFDITANQNVWHYGWDYMLQGTVPWVNGHFPGGWNGEASLSLATDFDSTHTYELTMYARTISNAPDTEQILVQMSGLQAQAVPEPSALALACLAVATRFAVRSRQGLAGRV